MSDVAIVWNDVARSGDVVASAGDLLTGGDLQTAVLVSLFCDRRAEPGDVLPEGVEDRMGWWADSETDRIGSRLWLLKRAKREPSTLQRAEQYAHEALQWLIDDVVLVGVGVVAEWSGSGMVLNVALTGPQGGVSSYRYGWVL